jgi:hypothetical protein
VLYSSSQPQAQQPTGSTGNFLWAGANNTVTINFAQAVNYYGFLSGTPDPSWGPGSSQGVRLYSGSTLVAGTYTADTLGLNGDTRFVNFFAAQGQAFTRAELLRPHEFRDGQPHGRHRAGRRAHLRARPDRQWLLRGRQHPCRVPDPQHHGLDRHRASTAELQDGIVTPNPARARRTSSS